MINDLKKVKAAVLVKPGRIEIQSFPYPEPENGALILKIEMSGICGSDKHCYNGFTKQYAGTEAETDTPFPIIPGHENAGIIDTITPKARKELEFYGKVLAEGDRVVICPDVICGSCWYCRHIHGWPWCEKNKAYGNAFTAAEYPHLFGGWAEYMYVLPKSWVFKVPNGLSPEIAVLSEIMSASCSLEKAREFSSVAKEGFFTGATVVVQGIGPLGLCTIIRARIMGAGNIVAIDGSDYRLNLAREFSADYCLNIKNTSQKERMELIKDITEGRGADLAVEAVGTALPFVEGVEILRRGGMYITVGAAIDQGEEVTFNISRHLCAKNIRLFGMNNHSSSSHYDSMKLMEKYRNQFPFERIISHRFKIDDAERALKKSMQPDSMKVVIQP